MFVSSILLAVLPFAALSSARPGSSWSQAHHRGVAHNKARSTQTFTLVDFYQGEDFFNEWDFFTEADPTGGYVNYQSLEDATSKGLAYVDCDNITVLAVDSWSNVSVGGNRDSVRISSQKNYTGGLFILDAYNMPAGCSLWPSWWTTGPNWPAAGEIDIVEGVNNQPTNQYTLHSGTDTACTIDIEPSSDSIGNGTELYTGDVLSSNCYSTADADAGCGFEDTSSTSFGSGFNNAEGGVFALLWEESGMSMYHFARSNIPEDITTGTPTPSSWGAPVGYWSGVSCDIPTNFYEHTIVIDTTICGNWAGAAYASSGCPGTCAEAVANNTNFIDAQWAINYVAVYQ